MLWQWAICPLFLFWKDATRVFRYQFIRKTYGKKVKSCYHGYMNVHKNYLLRMFIGLSLLAVAFLAVFVYLGSGRFDSFGETAIIMLAVSFVMMIVPISVWLIDHKYLSRKKGLRICMANSLSIFVLTVIWPVITIIKNEPCSPSNTICEVQLSWEILRLALLLTVLYFLINVCFLVDFSKIKK